ncbi:non-specific serine,threonine protein kinase, partial [Sarracenia purpurea var. burkii]
ALAAQELLKIAGCEGSLDESVSAFASHSRKCKQPLDVLPCGIKSTADSRGMDGRGRRLWDRFSSYVKEIIASCLSSRFQLPKVADSTSVGRIQDQGDLAGDDTWKLAEYGTLLLFTSSSFLSLLSE